MPQSGSNWTHEISLIHATNRFPNFIQVGRHLGKRRPKNLFSVHSRARPWQCIGMTDDGGIFCLPGSRRRWQRKTAAKANCCYRRRSFLSVDTPKNSTRRPHGSRQAPKNDDILSSSARRACISTTWEVSRRRRYNATARPTATRSLSPAADRNRKRGRSAAGAAARRRSGRRRRYFWTELAACCRTRWTLLRRPPRPSVAVPRGRRSKTAIGC